MNGGTAARLPARFRDPRLGFRVVLVLGLLCLPLFARDEYTISVMVVAGVFAPVAVGLVILIGKAGQLSLAAGAFAGMGAYTSALLTTRLGVDPMLTVVVGALLAGVVSYAVGRLVLRLKSFFLALATVALGELFVIVVRDTPALGGASSGGIFGIPAFGVAGLVASSTVSKYYVVWGIALIVLVVASRFMGSRVGRAWLAVATSETAASTLGVDVSAWKTKAFVVSSVFAAIGGSMYAFVMEAISYHDFSLVFSILAIIMVIVGGYDSIFGAVVGVVVMTWVGRSVTGLQQYSGAAYALILLVLLLALPKGLAGGFRPAQVRRIRRILKMDGRATRRQDSTAEAVVFGESGGETSTIDQPTAGDPSRPEAGAWEKQSTINEIAEQEAPCVPLPNRCERATLVHLEGIGVSFGGLNALQHVSVDVKEGEIAALIGPNGAGKTTLFNVMSGLQKSSTGSVFFDGENVTGWGPTKIARRGMARTFQNLRIFENMTVLENVMVGRHRHERSGLLGAVLGLRGQRKEERLSRERSLDALRVMGLEGSADQEASSLAYGRQRLLEIARALVSEPRVLLLDEPAAGLNTSEKAELVKTIAGIRDGGISVIVVEHDMDMVMGIADHVSVLDHGVLIADGAPAEVQCNDCVIEAYLGTKASTDSSSRPLGRRLLEGANGLHHGEHETPMLAVEGVSTYYGSIAALRGVDLEVRRGEIVAVLGANGAGKTTLLRTISGVLRAQEGRVLFNEEDIARLPPDQIVRRGIGHVPEGRHVFPTLTVHDHLTLGGHRRTDRSELERDREYVFELFPVLKQRRHQRAGTLSGGEQQMVAIGRALMGGPRLLVLDEPSMGLAPQVVSRIFETLLTLNERGTTILVVEQNAEMALSIADRAYVLQVGSVTLSGSAEELRRDERIRASYLGGGARVAHVYSELTQRIDSAAVGGELYG